MPAPVTLLMAVHSHQPIGNFGFVFEEAYAKAYEPFLRVLERHPQVRLSLHYSGCLLDWIQEHRPAFFDRLCQLVAKQQVELLASGYYEPVLPLIPEADRQGQIAKMRQMLWKAFGEEGTGLWLTERVWEPDLPATLANAGIRYTIVDTNQFAIAKPWLPDAMQVHDGEFWDLLGSYATEYTGRSVVLFPASKRLRYWMPFQAVDRTMEFLRRLQREQPVAVTFADDGEKFGLWPKTYRWVYEDGWLDQFFAALERERSWLKTTTFTDYVKTIPPNGTVSLPGGSYEEMLAWSGGHFRNFFTKYPEAYAMQQKMLRVSRQIEDGERGTGNGARGTRSPKSDGRKVAFLEQARQELYAGQCNCAYWHGVFGGLYLTHLRRAVYAHLIAAEDLARQAVDSTPRRQGNAAARPLVAVSDVDGDGQQEAQLTTADMGLLIDPAEGGTITEWSLVQPRLNLLDTLSRRQEPYHNKLRMAQPAASGGPAVASIHDMLGVKEQNLESYLVYDDHRRTAFIDYALQSLPSLEDVVRSTWGERRLWSRGPYQLERALSGQGGRRAASVAMTREVSGCRLRKTVAIASQQPAVTCLYQLEGSVPVVALEFNLSLRDERFLAGAQQHQQVRQFDVAEPAVGVRVELAIEPAATLFHFPIETVSESEGGLERTFQGLCLVCLWTLNGSGPWTARVDWTIGSAG